MESAYLDKVHRVNCMTNEMDALYHRAARRLGVPDSVLIVLYMLYEKGDGCRLYDVVNESGLSKQTVNSAVRMLEHEGSVYLEPDAGKTKRIRLTQTGRVRMAQTAQCLFEAERRVFGAWSEEEFETYLRLMKKYNDAFRGEVERLGTEE